MRVNFELWYEVKFRDFGAHRTLETLIFVSRTVDLVKSLMNHDVGDQTASQWHAFVHLHSISSLAYGLCAAKGRQEMRAAT